MSEKPNTTPETAAPESEVLGSKLNFATSEAYKLLRTNLFFSIAEDVSCRVVGVTSALRSEGKSTTSMNIGYTIAETGRKVLLIEGDMRLPTFAKRLGVAAAPGLSNVLAGWDKADAAIQQTGLNENLFCITAGDIPPNPSELLSSVRMKKFLEEISTRFEYVIIDLPPVNVVSDALVVSPLTHGMVMVVRQDFGERRALSQAMRLLSFAKVKVLGFVLNASGTRKGGGKYRRYGKYGKYYNRYYDRKGYGYGYGYGRSYGYGYGYGRSYGSSNIKHDHGGAAESKTPLGDAENKKADEVSSSVKK